MKKILFLVVVSCGNLYAQNGVTYQPDDAFGNVTVSGTLGVTGASTLTGNTTIGGTLGVTGLTSLSTLNTTGNVGIGTTAPVVKLHLYGNEVIRTANVTSTDYSTMSALHFYNPTSADTVNLLSFGFHDATRVSNSAYFGYKNTDTGGVGKGDLIWGTRSVNTDTAPSERMRLTSAGNVGINMSSPSQRLVVSGTVSVSGLMLPSAPTDGTLVCFTAGGGLGKCSGSVSGVACTCLPM